MPETNAANEPSIQQVYDALEAAIDAACGLDTRNDISREYRRIMREQGFTDGNEEDEESDVWDEIRESREPNGCGECARSNGPNYTGTCNH